jgi:hypothetical protein
MSNGIEFMGKFLIILGVIIAAMGGLLLIFKHSGIPILGKLPGDIIIKRENFTFYSPLATSIILSIILSLILYFISGRK